MHVLPVRNVREALPKGITYLNSEGRIEDSRAGKVMVAPGPVTTVYEKPWERVLFSKIRDANPFFHLFESFWLLVGRNDARWLDQFVSDFSQRFAEEDGHLHGSYGFRWRNHFDLDGGGEPGSEDQISKCVALLKADPTSRQVVLTMWDPVADLGAVAKDRPCNTHIYLRVYGKKLDITVCCRSNDLIWGLAGANAVQFSVLQEYLAARVGVNMGRYYQVSNNFHAYLNVLGKLEGVVTESLAVVEPRWTPIVSNPDKFDEDLLYFFNEAMVNQTPHLYHNPFFHKVAVPMYWTNHYWKAGNREAALANLNLLPIDCDWRFAAHQWLTKRMMKAAA
jgi:thymidylate synthase